MEEKMIPYFSHEGDMARMERANKRLWILLIIIFLAFVGSNMAWIVYENQFQDVVTSIEAEQEAEDGGNNYVVGGNMYEPTESESNN